MTWAAAWDEPEPPWPGEAFAAGWDAATRARREGMQAMFDRGVTLGKAAGRLEERQSIRQLAVHHNVRVDMGPLSDPPSVPFADLLGGDHD